jgi:hypothetical protein
LLRLCRLLHGGNRLGLYGFYGLGRGNRRGCNRVLLYLRFRLFLFNLLWRVVMHGRGRFNFSLRLMMRGRRVLWFNLAVGRLNFRFRRVLNFLLFYCVMNRLVFRFMFRFVFRLFWGRFFYRSFFGVCVCRLFCDGFFSRCLFIVSCFFYRRFFYRCFFS